MRELPRIGAEVAGYRLESMLSRGGMAVVYLAQDLRLNRMVALKILAVELAEDDSFRERFLRESRVAASTTRMWSRSTTRASRTACSTSRCATSRTPTCAACCARAARSTSTAQSRLRPRSPTRSARRTGSGSSNLESEKWSSLPPMRTPRHGMAVVGVANTLYAIDGAPAPTHAESTNVVEALDLRPGKAEG
jgi:hypothetical protein